MKSFILLCLFLIGLSSDAQTFYMDSVITYTQGLTNSGNQITSSRSNPLNSLGQPQMNDIETGNLNFFSLGFGGSIVLKTEYPVLVNPLSQLQIFETTYSYNCSYYPEKAKIYVSKNNQNFELLGETCGNNNTIFSLYQKIDTINYIKIDDCSDPSKFSNFIDADAYDLDGIQIYNLVPLSIELDFFNAKMEDDVLLINFRTLSESGTLRFYIQSSTDAINSGSIKYDQKESVEYVRLKEVDINGDIFYFSPVPITKKYKVLKGTFYDLLGRQTREGNFLIKY